jgi:hypothetical protein
MFQQAAGLMRFGGIHGFGAFIDMPDHAASVNDEGDAMGE